MRSGYKITLGILTIMILVTITIGTSYSYYSIASSQTKPNEFATTCFSVSFSEGSNGSINLSPTYPMSETTAMTLQPYNFTITNNCTSSNASDGINYVVTLNTLTASIPDLNLSYIRYKLNRTSNPTETGTSALLGSLSPYDLSPTIKSEQGIDTSYNLATGKLNPGESVTYDLYLWIDENAGNNVMNQSFTGRVLVYSYL